MTTLQRLLKYPHDAVFDKDPAPELAFRLRHPLGATWSVGDRVLTASAGGDDFTYDLSALTIAALASALQADGFEVLSLNSSVSAASALSLADGSGDQYESNGDRVHVFTSILWAMLGGYAGEVSGAGAQVRQALRQMVIGQAEGEWLDVWGTLYGVLRKDGETDQAYGTRVSAEALRARVNGHSIEKAILDATGFDVRIEEPWKDLFVLDESVLSGPHRMYDGERYGYHLIRPFARQSVDWDRVRPVIDRNRAAGVAVVEYRVLHGAYVDASAGSVGIAAKNTHLGRAAVLCENSVLLDYMEIGDVAVLNHTARHGRVMVRTSEVVVDTAQYAVTAAHLRTYRVYQTSVDYVGQYWAPTSWAGTTGTWELNVIVTSSHTRSS